MWYAKNLPVWERLVRFFVGAAVAGVGFWVLKGSPWAWLVAAGSVVLVLTGSVGFCPMCAMVGRKPLASKEDAPK